MGKGKIILILVIVLAIVMPVGGVAYEVAGDECSQSPSGEVHFELLGDGWVHFLDEDYECDPWQVVEPEQNIASITIIPYSFGNRPSTVYPVRIERDGHISIWSTKISILGTKDAAGTARELLIEKRDLVLATDLLDDLGRYTSFDVRFTDIEMSERAERHGVPSAYYGGSTLLHEPKIHCRWLNQDCGGVSLMVELSDATEKEVLLDGLCFSIAKRQAIEATSFTMDQVYKALDHNEEGHDVDKSTIFEH